MIPGSGDVAIAADLVVAETPIHRPEGISQASSAIRTTLSGRGFDWVQGSPYTRKDEDLARLFSAIMALKGLPGFPQSVRDLRAFRVEQGSDFTTLMKTRAPRNRGPAD